MRIASTVISLLFLGAAVLAFSRRDL